MPEFFCKIRPHVFINGVGGDKDADIQSYSSSEINLHNSEFHKQLKFRFAATRQKNVIASRGLRNTAAVDLLSNDAIADGTSTNFKELLRYMIDDMVLADVDKTFLLCISKTMNDEFAKKLSDGAREQRKLKLAGDDCKISGHLYHNLLVKITVADDHLSIKSGVMRLPEFCRKYNNHSGDFVVSIVGTELTLNFPWQRLVSDASNIMFFGSPFTITRSFNTYFRFKTDEKYLFHIFKSLAVETNGDALLSSSLYTEYITTINAIRGTQLLAKESAPEEALLLRLQERTTTQKVFIEMFNNLCKGQFVACLTKFNDYSKELIDPFDLDAFTHAAEHKAFPDQWRVLASLRGIDKYRKEKPNVLQFKKHQIFFQILGLLRMSNPRQLSWWAMIQSVANFGWGVSATATDLNSFWGTTVNVSTRNSRMSQLSSNLTYRYRSLLSQSYAHLFCFDNMQVGQKMEDQIGQHSSSYFEGTHECTHRVHTFEDTTWNDEHVLQTGLPGQAYPSPVGMPAYESLAPVNKSLSSFLVSHAGLVGDSDVDMTGARVNAHERVLRMTYINDRVQHVFTRQPKHYDQIPTAFDRPSIMSMRDHCVSDGATAFFNANRSFHLGFGHWPSITSAIVTTYLAIENPLRP